MCYGENMGPRVYVGTRGCLPTVGVGWGCLVTTIAYVTGIGLVVRRVLR